MSNGELRDWVMNTETLYEYWMWYMHDKLVPEAEDTPDLRASLVNHIEEWSMEVLLETRQAATTDGKTVSTGQWDLARAIIEDPTTIGSELLADALMET